MSFFYKIIRILLFCLFKFIYPIKVNCKYNLPNTGKMIICSNHISNMDPIFLIISQKRQINFMAKKEIFKNKLVAIILNALGAFPIDRKNSGSKSINKTFEILKNENILGIFLEGTRSKDGEFLKPKSGVAMISYKTNSDILPVCITPKKGKKIKPFKKTIISYGEIIKKKHLKIKEASGLEFRTASRFIMEKISKLREI